MVSPKKVKLGSSLVGGGESVYVIAEGGLTNWGDLSLAKKQVDMAMAAECDAVKFQAQTTEEIVSKRVDPYWYKRLKYKELSHDELRELWGYCEIRNIQCFITAHTDVDLDFLDKDLNVPFFKIGSGESINYDFLKNVGSRKKPVIISLGLHLTDEEIKKSIKTLEDAGTKEIVVLHCNTVYPTPPEINNLSMIGHLKSSIDYPVGYSDHSIGHHMIISAVALGAKVVEKHISFDKSDKRSLDCPGSCLAEDLKQMVKEIREVEVAMKDPGESRADQIKNARKWARQSIVAKTDMMKGTVIKEEMLAFKRPGTGIEPKDVKGIVGKKVVRDVRVDELLLVGDVE